MTPAAFFNACFTPIAAPCSAEVVPRRHYVGLSRGEHAASSRITPTTVSNRIGLQSRDCSPKSKSAIGPNQFRSFSPAGLATRVINTSKRGRPRQEHIATCRDIGIAVTRCPIPPEEKETPSGARPTPLSYETSSRRCAAVQSERLAFLDHSPDTVAAMRLLASDAFPSISRIAKGSSSPRISRFTAPPLTRRKKTKQISKRKAKSRRLGSKQTHKITQLRRDHAGDRHLPGPNVRRRLATSNHPGPSRRSWSTRRLIRSVASMVTSVH